MNKRDQTERYIQVVFNHDLKTEPTSESGYSSSFSVEIWDFTTGKTSWFECEDPKAAVLAVDTEADKNLHPSVGVIALSYWKVGTPRAALNLALAGLKNCLQFAVMTKNVNMANRDRKRLAVINYWLGYKGPVEYIEQVNVEVRRLDDTRLPVDESGDELMGHDNRVFIDEHIDQQEQP